MSEWDLTTLGEALTPVKRPVSVADLIEVPWAGARWYAEGIYARLVEAAVNVKAKTLNRLEIDDITYNRMWATKAAFGVVGQDSAGCLVTGDFPIFVADRGRLLPEYMRAVFQSPNFQKEASLRAVGTTERRRLKEPDFLAMQVALPSPSEQRRIVDVMAAVDAQIKSVAEELDRLLPLRIRLFLDSDDLQAVTIEQLADVSQGKALPKAVQGQRTGDVSWFKIADMTGPGNEDGYMLADTRLAREHVSRLKGAVVATGSVVFPRVGAAVLTEKKRVLDVEGAVDENHLVLTPKEGVSSECLLAAVESIRLSELVQTGAVPSLNMGLIRKAQIPWSARSSAQLDSALGKVREEVRKLRAEFSRLRAFRSALLSSLLNQEIEIPEAYDALLEGVS